MALLAEQTNFVHAFGECSTVLALQFEQPITHWHRAVIVLEKDQLRLRHPYAP
jgi:hypothetical protein